jgi:hypothetical protein
MAVATDPFNTWLEQAHLAEQQLTPEQRAILQAAFRFRHHRGADYYSTRLLSHFLLHCSTGLKVAQIARLLGLSRPTASRQQGLSSKEVFQQVHHRLDGRPYGKLLPRYAGPIAQFLCQQPNASRADLIDFIRRTFGVHVSRIALYKFLKKYGLDHVGEPAAQPPPTEPPPTAPLPTEPPPRPVNTRPIVLAAPPPPPPFSPDAPSTPAPS